MKKGMLKVTITLVLILLLLVSCKGKVGGGEKTTDTASILRQVQTGTQGLEIKFLQNYPPPMIFDQNDLIAIIDVRNRGNHDLEAEDCFVQITGHAPDIITGGFNFPRSCAENIGVLEGKNIYNVEGGFNQIEYASSNIALPIGVFEYNPTLNIKACYNYQTIANPQVCIDPGYPHQIAPEQKACDYETKRVVSGGGGQGAPVGVSSVRVDMAGSKVFFEINVQNYGKGTVLSPFSDIRNCGEASLERTDVDKLIYTVSLAGGSLISCSPGDNFVRLNNNQGKIICSFNVPGFSAFETPLLIDLDYNYIQSYKQPLKIVQTPGSQ